MRYRYYTCDVFTDTRFGGNPLAVLPEAEGLSAAQMQQVARIQLLRIDVVFDNPIVDHRDHRKVDHPFLSSPSLFQICPLLSRKRYDSPSKSKMWLW